MPRDREPRDSQDKLRTNSFSEQSDLLPGPHWRIHLPALPHLRPATRALDIKNVFSDIRRQKSEREKRHQQEQHAKNIKNREKREEFRPGRAIFSEGPAGKLLTPAKGARLSSPRCAHLLLITQEQKLELHRRTNVPGSEVRLWLRSFPTSSNQNRQSAH